MMKNTKSVVSYEDVTPNQNQLKSVPRTVDSMHLKKAISKRKDRGQESEKSARFQQNGSRKNLESRYNSGRASRADSPPNYKAGGQNSGNPYQSKQNNGPRKQGNGKKRRGKNRRSQYKQLPKGATFTLTSTNFKTQKCSFYEKGCCRKGDQCSYRHDFEIKVLNEICKFYLSGNCHKQNCVFSHDLASYPCKFYHISMNCQKLLTCPFNHGKFPSSEAADKFIKENFEEVYKHIIAGF
jgi:hypothetical protein